MKKTVLFTFALAAAIHSFAQTNQANQVNLSGVTIGIGAGPHTVFGNLQEYSLSPDSSHSLHVEGASKSGFVISSVITVRLGRLAKQKGSGKLLSQRKISKNTKQLGVGFDSFSDTQVEDAKADPMEKWAINLAINLADVSGSGLAFNKYIDGGIGIGYYFNDHIQLSAFLDLMRYRQMRQYIVDTYDGKPIPNGTGTHTALDPTDNSLFTTKTFAGVSLKLVYTLNATND